MVKFASLHGQLGVIKSGGSSIPAILKDGNTPAWFDMAENYMTKDGGNLVSQWADRSGNDNHILQATGLDQPLWSLNGVLFDGIRQFMKCVSFTLEQPEFIYAVLRQKTWTSNDPIWDGNGINSGRLMQRTSTPHVRIYAGAEIPADNSQSLTLDTFGIVRALYNGVSSSLQINEGVKATGDTGANNMSGFTLGANALATFFGHIEVKEAIIRKAADSDANSLIIYNYLKDKYSL